MSNILVISPHPDDESIACGGTICVHVAQGDSVQVIFLTSGEKGGHGSSEAETIETREREALQATLILAISDPVFWREPDGNFISTEKNVLRLCDIIITYAPEIIYCPHEDEDHTDHKQAVKLVVDALKQLPDLGKRPLVYGYEVWTPIQKIDLIVDISEHVEKKQNAIQAHKSQCSVLAFDEAILGLNRYRGEMHSWPGGDYAEIFKRIIIES